MQISFVHQDKIKLLNSIEPNVINNRFDLLYGNDYELIEVKDSNSVAYIPFKKSGMNGRLGLYLRDISSVNGDILSECASFLFNNYSDLQDIFILHTYTPIPDIEQSVHWHVDLPETIEIFDSELSSKVRYNTKWYPKKIRENEGDYEIKNFKAEECPKSVIETYLKWKRKTYEYNWDGDAKEYISQNGITNVYVMQIKDKLAAIGFVCITGENVFYENTAYNDEYKKYSVGIVLYHYIIDDLIKKRKKKLFLLGGNMEYKRHYNGIPTMTYTGYMYRDPDMHKKVLKIASKFRRLPLPKKIKKKIASLYGRFFLSEYYRKYLKSEVVK